MTLIHFEYKFLSLRFFFAYASNLCIISNPEIPTFLLCNYSKGTSIPLTSSIHSRIYASPLNNSECTLFRQAKILKVPTRRCDKSHKRGAMWFTACGPPSFSLDNWQIFLTSVPRKTYVFVFAIHVCQPARARFLPSASGCGWNNRQYSPDEKARSAATPDEESPRYKGRRETEPFPRRVRHLQRKLNDSAQFARTRSMRRMFASSTALRSRVTGPLPSFPRSRLRPPIKILKCETCEKLCES